MKKEIEVKARVKDFKEIKSALEAMGCVWSVPTVQADEIFLHNGVTFENIKLGDEALRIRETKGKAIFTLKKTQDNWLDKIEKEVEVSDAATMREAILHMDYYSAAKVVKTRLKTNFREMEICLDEVKDLGSFIEAEKITGDDAGKTQEELFAFLESVGVKREDQVFKGYDILMYESLKK